MIKNNKRHSKIPGLAEIHNLTFTSSLLNPDKMGTRFKWNQLPNASIFNLLNASKHSWGVWGLYSRNRPVNKQGAPSEVPTSISHLPPPLSVPPSLSLTHSPQIYTCPIPHLCSCLWIICPDRCSVSPSGDEWGLKRSLLSFCLTV